jgi:hypothetical protein
MSTDSSISDVMDSSITDTSVSKTSTAATEDSDMSMPLPANVLVYTLSHLHPTVIMETRRESLFNFRRRVHLREVAAAPFRPISTLNMHLPNDMDPRMPIHCDIRLSRQTLVEFDAFSHGLANEALRRKSENCIIGDFTNEEIQAERARQFNLFLYALYCEDEDGIRKIGLNIPQVNIVYCIKL